MTLATSAGPPAQNPPCGPIRRRGLSHRARAWIVALTVLALAATYVVAWGTYAYVHMNSTVRYTVLDPGQPVVLPAASVELVDLSLALSLTSEYTSQGPTSPDPGAVWAVATMEVTITPGTTDPLCVFRLVGPDRRLWEPASGVTGRTLPSSCSDDEVPVGRPTRIEVVFEVPEGDADQLVGVAVSGGGSWHRLEVLRPA
jgi:hypothetical protein